MFNFLGHWLRIWFGDIFRIPLIGLSGFWEILFRVPLKVLSGFWVTLGLAVPEFLSKTLQRNKLNKF